MITTLAQLTSPNVPQLPDPPVLERYFLESPLVVIGALVVLGVVAGVILVRSGKDRLGIAAGFAGVALAAGVWLLADQVETEREVIRGRSRQLEEAVAEADPTRASSLLAQDVEAVSLVTPRGAGLDWILDFIRTDMAGRFAIHEHRVRRVEAVIDGPNVARSQIHVTVTPEFTRAPQFVVVKLDWRRELPDGEWLVIGITPVHVAGVSNPTGR